MSAELLSPRGRRDRVAADPRGCSRRGRSGSPLPTRGVNAAAVMQVTDPLGRSTGYTYDPLNQVTQVTDALGDLTQFGYDENGNLRTVTDARVNTTTYAYNNMDRAESRTDPLLRPGTYLYNNNRNPTSFNHPKSQAPES